ncbi:MAG: hypothetical protein ACUVQ8_08265 [Nitrososphaeria archaeon]
MDDNTDWHLWVHDRQNINDNIVSGDLPEDCPNYWLLYSKDRQIAQDLGLNAFRLGLE